VEGKVLHNFIQGLRQEMICESSSAQHLRTQGNAGSFAPVGLVLCRRTIGRPTIGSRNRCGGEPAHGLAGRDLNGQVGHDSKYFLGNKFRRKTLPNTVEDRDLRRKEMLEEPTT
jgi:hypothetical protein